MKKKKNWTAEQKLQIVLYAVKGEATVEAICKKFGVAPSQVHAWKKHFLENGADIFGNKKSVEPRKDYQQEPVTFRIVVA